MACGHRLGKHEASQGMNRRQRRCQPSRKSARIVAVTGGGAKSSLAGTFSTMDASSATCVTASATCMMGGAAPVSYASELTTA